MLTHSSPLTWPPPRLYELCDRGSTSLIFLIIIVSPWAFGCTTDWAMHVANALGYTLGLFLVGKWIVRWKTGFRPARIGDRNRMAETPGLSRAQLATRALALITVAVLAQCLISALNARATYSFETGSFTYHQCVSWLPHSYDAASSWAAFWNYLAWAAIFWAIRDWLQGMSEREVVARLEEDAHPQGSRGLPYGLPDRLRTLLWVLSINGAILAMEGLIQQTSGTHKLLWVLNTRYNRSAESQFGPFPYRASGAQYLNLIWPVTLGFWWMLEREKGRTKGSHGRSLPTPATHVLPACVMIMVVAPIISLSRGALLVAAADVLAASGLLLFTGSRHQPLGKRFAIVLMLCAGVAGGLFISWKELADRMKELDEGFKGRAKLSEIGRRMAADAPLFGTGPETLQPLYQLYKGGADEYWPGQLHNDWLETRVTFGLAGLVLIIAGLILCFGSWWTEGGIPVSWRFVSFLWLGMGGCLVHARWDLPFQVYSIALLFLIFCSVLSCLSRPSRSP